MTITAEHYAKAESNGISKSALRQRVRRGWDIDRAVSEPLVSSVETIRRAAAKTPIRKTMQLHFGRERFY